MHRSKLPGIQLVPDLEPGLTVLRQPTTRSSSFHRLAVEALPQQGRTLWVDAASMASSYTLYELAPSERWLRGLSIARAFTAYQHFSLVKQVIHKTSRRPPQLIVAPALTSLYRDDDVPEHDHGGAHPDGDPRGPWQPQTADPGEALRTPAARLRRPAGGGRAHAQGDLRALQ